MDKSPLPVTVTSLHLALLFGAPHVSKLAGSLRTTMLSQCVVSITDLLQWIATNWPSTTMHTEYEHVGKRNERQPLQVERVHCSWKRVNSGVSSDHDEVSPKGVDELQTLFICRHCNACIASGAPMYCMFDGRYCSNECRLCDLELLQPKPA